MRLLLKINEKCDIYKTFYGNVNNIKGFPDGSDGSKTPCNVGDLGSIPALGRSPGEGKGYPLQYSGLENSMGCIIHGVTKSQIQLSNFHCHCHDFKVTVKLNLE